MRNETRQKFNEFTGQVAKLNAVSSATVQFNVQPSVQQTLETKMQESVAFLGMINIIQVDDMKGQKVGIGITSTIAGRTDTDKKTVSPTARTVSTPRATNAPRPTSTPRSDTASSMPGPSSRLPAPSS